MSALFKNHWHWHMIKIIVKYSLKYNDGKALINRGMIEKLQNHPQIIKELLRRGDSAHLHLKTAVNQFNNVNEESQIDNSIYEMIKWEKEIEDLEEYTSKELERILKN